MTLHLIAGESHCGSSHRKNVDTTNPAAAIPTIMANAPHCDSPQTQFYFYPAHPSTAAHWTVADLL